jgi:hypothetical protein
MGKTEGFSRFLTQLSCATKLRGVGKAARQARRDQRKTPLVEPRPVKLPPLSVEDLMRVPPSRKRQTFATALEALEALQAERISRDLTIQECVKIARDQGATWAEIGLRLEMSPWGASKRFHG